MLSDLCQEPTSHLPFPDCPYSVQLASMHLTNGTQISPGSLSCHYYNYIPYQFSVNMEITFFFTSCFVFYVIVLGFAVSFPPKLKLDSGSLLIKPINEILLFCT